MVTMLLRISSEGFKTTLPELSCVYGRGLAVAISGGSLSGEATAVCAQFAGILRTLLELAKSHALNKHAPIDRVVRQLSRVAGTHVCCRYPVVLEGEIHKLIHVPLHNHVRI